MRAKRVIIVSQENATRHAARSGPSAGKERPPRDDSDYWVGSV